MKQTIMPDTRVETQYLKFGGGLDLISPVLSLRPGCALEAVNYEPGQMGGYKRIDGFERFDGRPAPSRASYTYLEGDFPFMNAGLALRGATSDATAVVALSEGRLGLDAAPGAVAVTKVVGTFQPGELITTMDFVVRGTLVTATERGHRTAEGDARALAAAADQYRADIGQVPGAGPLRGIWMFNGTLYAFRDTGPIIPYTPEYYECALYKSTYAGWVRVDLGRQMQVQQPSVGVTTSAGAVNWTAHGLAAGAPVRLGGTLPTGAAANTTYYVVNPTANTFQIAAAIGGTAIVLGDVASGLKALPQAQMVNEGDIITGATSGATATVKRVALRSGDWNSFAATATVVLASVTGTFQAGEALKVGGAVKLGAASVDSATRLLQGGRFEFVTHNFSGASSTRRMYGVDGVNPAFEFDGSVFMPILTGMVPDNPQFIAAHKNKLFLSFKGSVQHSGDGSPYKWTILSGADELGIGDDVTGMAVQAGDTLAIFGRNSSFQLNGATNASFQMLPISGEVGAIPYTVQTVGKTFALDDRGIISTDRTQAYGNFVQSTISAAVQPLIDKLRMKVVGSVAYRNRSQMRIFASDGSGLIVGFGESGPLGITKLQYPVKPTCFASCEDGSGTAVVFFGADNGYVYQADAGSSFDGAAIESYLRMPFNNISTPRLRKRFRKAVMEMSATAYAAIRFQPEFDYGSPDVGTHRLQTAEALGSGGYWDADNWEGFFYDAQIVTAPEFSIEGAGLNMALVFYSSSAIDLGHVLQGLITHFSIRRLSR